MDRTRDKEDEMITSNASVADRALELAEGSGGLRRQAALCVSIAAATTGTARSARKALEGVPHAALRDAARSLLAELVAEPVPAGAIAVMRGSARGRHRIHQVA